MLNVLRRIGRGIVGAVAGAVTGLFAGFIPGAYYLLTVGSSLWADHSYGAPFVSLFMLGVYLATLPFFMLFQMGRGIVAGAVGGPLAGLTYPKTLNEQFKTERKNKALLRSIDGLGNEMHLLLVNEIIENRKLLQAKNGNVDSFNAKVEGYKEALISKLLLLDPNKKVEILQADSFQKNLVAIKTSDAKGNIKNYIIEKDTLLELARERERKSLPMLITIGKEQKEQVEIISAGQISQGGEAFNLINQVISDVRGALNARRAIAENNKAAAANTAKMQRYLGVTPGNAGAAPAAPKAETNAERVARLQAELAQAKAQAEEEARTLLEDRDDQVKAPSLS